MSANPRRLGGRVTALTDRLSERAELDRLVDAVRGGESGTLVVRGDPGVGKTVLLDHLAGRASGSGCRVARAAGVQSEMELAFAGLHQLCAPMLNRAERLPEPQRDALQTAFGIAAGAPPDRFLVGLAVLSLLAGVAGGTTADLPDRRRAVAGPGLGAGAGVHGSAARRRSGRAGVRGPRSERGSSRAAGAGN